MPGGFDTFFKGQAASFIVHEAKLDYQGKVISDCFTDTTDNFKVKPPAILRAASPVVCPLIKAGRLCLAQQIAVSAMNLDSIETSLPATNRRRREIVDDTFDFFLRHLPVRLFTLRDEGHGQGRNSQSAKKAGLDTGMNYLQGYFCAVLPGGADHPLQAGYHLIRMAAVLAGICLTMGRDKSVSTDNQTDAPFSQLPVQLDGCLRNRPGVIGGAIPGRRPHETVLQFQITNSELFK